MKPPRFRKDYYGGALMVFVGLAAAFTAVGYKVGTPAHVGPGFFPLALGVLLALTGLLIAVSARRDPAPPQATPGHSPHGLPDLRGGLCILLGALAFLLFGVYGGLVPATFAIVFISALGDRGNSVFQAFMLSMAMCGSAVLVFWWALQVQLPLFRWGL